MPQSASIVLVATAIAAAPSGLARSLGWGATSLILLGFVGILGWIIARYSARNLLGQERTTRFAWLLTGALVSLAVMTTATSLVTFALGWTLSGLALTALIAHPHTVRALHAARYVRRRLLIGDATLWAAVIAAGVTLPSLSLSTDITSTTPVAAWLILGLLVSSVVIRSALVPSHSWLTETSEAPSPVSALLHAGLVNGGGVLVLALWSWFAAVPGVLAVLLVLGAITVIVGTVLGRVRGDVKGQLVHSTTAQMGYMTVQLGLGLPAAALLHIVGHGFYKSWLFLRAGGAVSRSRARNAATLNDSADPSKTAGAVAALCATSVAAVAGAPAALASVSALGPTAWVPVVLSIVTAGSAGMLAYRAHTTIPRACATGVIAGLAAATYLWLLFGTEQITADAWGAPINWAPATATALVLTTGSALLAAALLARKVIASPMGALATVATLHALPAWHRQLRQIAEPSSAPAGDEAMVTRRDVDRALNVVAGTYSPNWPLRTFVAANPLAGLESVNFDQIAGPAAAAFGTDTYLPETEFVRMYNEGTITRDHLIEAIVQAHEDRGLEPLGPAVLRSAEQLIRTAPAHDTATDAGTTDRVVSAADTHTAHWAARCWGQVNAQGSLWVTWRNAASSTAYSWAAGNPRVRPVASCLSDDPTEALVAIANHHGVAADHLVSFLTEQARSVPGWTAHARWRDREAPHAGRSGSHAHLAELLAVHATLDALISKAPRVIRTDIPEATAEDFLLGRSRRSLWQRALEISITQPVITGVVDAAHNGAPSTATKQQPARADVITCIDVRSERLRRALEARGHRTFGFAGFFGAALRYHASPDLATNQCPVLIQPTTTVTARRGASLWRHPLTRSTGALNSAPVTPLVLAEAGGLVAGVAALMQTVLPHRWKVANSAWTVTNTDGFVTGMSVADSAALAAGALKAIGLVDNFAPLIVVCGHGATVENNAFASGYDCGACGGNTGEINAQVLANALNDPAVRLLLRDEGIVIPDTTTAIAALHNTTTDEVAIVAAHQAAPQALEDFRADCAVAQKQVVAERSTLWPAAHTSGVITRSPQHCAHGRVSTAQRRAGDWSEAFPEWGLASNAMFIVGPRELTEGLDLAGRAFLHSYEPDLDADHSTLQLILTAPTIVTQWINSQYYCSTVAHSALGAGDKATHNVVGDVGVLTGSHGDLRIGLPWQAVFTHDPRTGAHTRRHDPARLTVVVWAHPTAIMRIVSSHENLAQLVTNQWIHLVAVNPATGRAHRLTPELSWAHHLSSAPEEVPATTQPANAV